MTHPTDYDDGRISCDAEGITIRGYYPWGPRHIAYSAIQRVERLPLTGASRLRRWRIWGSGDFVHWWNFDPGRTRKELALVLVLNTGRTVRPTITPDDPEAVERILRSRMGT